MHDDDIIVFAVGLAATAVFLKCDHGGLGTPAALAVDVTDLQDALMVALGVLHGSGKYGNTFVHVFKTELAHLHDQGIRR